MRVVATQSSTPQSQTPHPYKAKGAAPALLVYHSAVKLDGGIRSFIVSKETAMEPKFCGPPAKTAARTSYLLSSILLVFFVGGNVRAKDVGCHAGSEPTLQAARFLSALRADLRGNDDRCKPNSFTNLTCTPGKKTVRRSRGRRLYLGRDSGGGT
jgi:hypothetical protein